MEARKSNLIKGNKALAAYLGVYLTYALLVDYQSLNQKA